MGTTLRSLIPLESGDRLTREEFHRRYCARPDIKKAELIEGVVYVASPVRFGMHGRQHALVILWLGAYAATHPGVEVADNTTVYMGAKSEVQPDACLFRLPPLPSNVRVTDENYLEGAPDLVVEVAASSASYDLHDKMEVYRRAGVQEYIVWQVYEGRIDWFGLHEGAYRRVVPDERGVITSAVFPSLRLAVARMLAGDRAGVLAELASRE